MPGQNTSRRTLKRDLCLVDLDREVCTYLRAWAESGNEVRITLDGKKVRGTIAFGETRGLHLLAAYLPGQAVVLAQLAVDTKTNDTTAAPQLLKVPDLQGEIVTGDATFAQRAMSQLIVQAAGDYIWTVKDNRVQLKQDIQQQFADDQRCVPGFSPGPTDFASVRTTNGGHGRIETRTPTTSCLLNESCRWPRGNKSSNWNVRRPSRPAANNARK